MGFHGHRYPRNPGLRAPTKPRRPRGSQCPAPFPPGPTGRSARSRLPRRDSTPIAAAGENRKMWSSGQRAASTASPPVHKANRVRPHGPPRWRKRPCPLRQDALDRPPAGRISLPIRIGAAGRPAAPSGALPPAPGPGLARCDPPIIEDFESHQQAAQARLLTAVTRSGFPEGGGAASPGGGAISELAPAGLLSECLRLTLSSFQNLRLPQRLKSERRTETISQNATRR